MARVAPLGPSDLLKRIHGTERQKKNELGLARVTPLGLSDLLKRNHGTERHPEVPAIRNDFVMLGKGQKARLSPRTHHALAGAVRCEAIRLLSQFLKDLRDIYNNTCVGIR